VLAYMRTLLDRVPSSTPLPQWPPRIKGLSGLLVTPAWKGLFQQSFYLGAFFMTETFVLPSRPSSALRVSPSSIDGAVRMGSRTKWRLRRIGGKNLPFSSSKVPVPSGSGVLARCAHSSWVVSKQPPPPLLASFQASSVDPSVFYNLANRFSEFKRNGLWRCPPADLPDRPSCASPAFFLHSSSHLFQG